MYNASQAPVNKALQSDGLLRRPPLSAALCGRTITQQKEAQYGD
jgi:hypothetical protein